MCSLGALRAGAGLVEFFVPEEIYEIVAAAAAPEVMVRPVESYDDLLEEPDRRLGRRSRPRKIACQSRFSNSFATPKQPMVLDADGLNILVRENGHLEEGAGPRLLTPHPGRDEAAFP